MTLYGYINPVSEANPNNKCIIYKGKDILYIGKIGDIPFKYGNLLYQNVVINDKTLLIFVKEIKYVR